MKLLIIVYALLILVLCMGCRGPQGVQGGQGQVGIPGQTIVGPAGPVGAPGLNGTNGQDGTIVTPIQFCPGSVPTYPSTFPEYGFCIDNQLYAVYSANGGFLALIPDGDYQSNAVGSSCSFHVSGCTVTGL